MKISDENGPTLGDRRETVEPLITGVKPSQLEEWSAAGSFRTRKQRSHACINISTDTGYEHVCDPIQRRYPFLRRQMNSPAMVPRGRVCTHERFVCIGVAVRWIFHRADIFVVKYLGSRIARKTATPGILYFTERRTSGTGRFVKLIRPVNAWNFKFTLEKTDRSPMYH